MKDERQVKLTRKGSPLTEFVSQLSLEAADEQAKRWLVLRNKTRLRLIDLLNRYDGLLCVSELAEVLQVSTPVMSSHLAILRKAKLVEAEKFKTFNYYRLRPDAFEAFWDYLEGFVSE